MISIVIPVYNRKELVRRAIRSALSQTHTDFEIIVVDDGSDDGTAQLLEETYGEQDRILILPQATNRGVSASRNLGIGAASGEWIALLDSDDEWRPPKLERQLSALLESELRVCHTNEIWIRNGVRVNPHKHHRKRGGRIFFDALPLCAMSPSSIVVRRDVFDSIGLFDETLPACEDYDLFLRLTCRFDVLYVDEELVVKYGGHDDQLSRAHCAMDRFRVKALDRVLTESVGKLTAEEKEAARMMLLQKARIVYDGAVKRGNDDLRQRMSEYMASWHEQLSAGDSGEGA